MFCRMFIISCGYFAGIVMGRHVFLDAFRAHYGVGVMILAIAIASLQTFRSVYNQRLSNHIFGLGFFIVGSFWGLLNSAPIPDRRMVAEVERVNVDLGATPALVLGADHHIYEVSSAGPPGTIGEVRIWSRPAVFSMRRATLTTSYAAEPRSFTRWNQLAEGAQKYFAHRIKAYEPSMAAWLRSAVLGIPGDLNPGLARAFRRTGLLHLVVVSGSHITMLAVGVLAVFATPFRLAYGLRLINPGWWIGLSVLIKLFVMACVLLFCTIVGASHASQRAVLGFIVLQGSRIFFGELPVVERLSWTLIAQILVFPIGMLCESTVMSWLAYLMVVDMATESRAGGRLVKALKLQTALSITMGAMCGQWSILGILANILLIPLIPLVFAFGVLLVLPEIFPEAVTNLALGIQEKFLQIVCWISDVTEGLPWVTANFASRDLWLRYLLLIFGVTMTLNLLAKMSIRQESEGQGFGRLQGGNL